MVELLPQVSSRTHACPPPTGQLVFGSLPHEGDVCAWVGCVPKAHMHVRRWGHEGGVHTWEGMCGLHICIHRGEPHVGGSCVHVREWGSGGVARTLHYG